MIEIRVAELMGRRRLTKKDVATMTGIRPNTIADLWYGRSKRIDLKHLDSLCAALDCQPGDILAYISNDV